MYKFYYIGYDKIGVYVLDTAQQVFRNTGVILYYEFINDIESILQHNPNSLQEIISFLCNDDIDVISLESDLLQWVRSDYYINLLQWIRSDYYIKMLEHK